MSNPRVSLDALVAPHVEETVRRASKLKYVLAIHDTTTCKFAHADPNVIGYLNTGKAGFMVHYTLLVEPGAFPHPLGIPHIDSFFRKQRPRTRKEGGRRSPPGSATTKKKHGESRRWLDGISHTAALLGDTPVIHLADREGDSYALLAKCIEAGQRFVIRVRISNRRVRTPAGMKSLRDVVGAAQTALTREIVLSPRKANPAPGSAQTHRSRRSREAELALSATRLELDRPRYFGSELPQSLSVNVVRATEMNAPKNEQPVEWLLFTTEPVSTPSQIAAVVDMYRARWLIEECNKALKTGCLYEHRQFESRDALLTLLGLSLPIACEILALRTQTRQSPDAMATTRLTQSQVEVLRHFSPRKLPKNPTLKQALLGISALGGHQQNNGPPGWLVIQRGMTKLLAYDEGWRAAIERKKM
jgi:hypothetical protein